MDLTNFPIIDWELGTRLAGNKKELAEEMMDLLMKSLSMDFYAIKQVYANQDFQALLQRVHRLHGALSYCGLPRLKKVIIRLESELKNNIMENLPSLLHQLDTEINLLLEHHSRLRLQSA